MPRALITGVGGQDGSLMAEFLLEKKYEVYGIVRRHPSTMPNLAGVMDKVHFLYGDLRDSASITEAIHKSRPDEIYNFGAQSFVPPSWIDPEDTLDINAGGLARILSIMERSGIVATVYQASSSEMFGDQRGVLNEQSPFLPTSPYGVSKLAAHRLVDAYREKGIRAVAGILFNHESERRGEEMVTMKICRHVARFACGITEPLRLGNLDARRDWGHAPCFIEAIWLMTRKAETNYVIGTGESHSVSECLDMALEAVNLDSAWFRSHWMQIDVTLQRPGEIHFLCADASKAHRELDWKPRVTFEQMIQRMVESEMRKVTGGK